jgi:septal ring factor EnvC (AmiA/AmiB activator)
MLGKWLRNRKQKKIDAQIQQEAATRAVLSDSLRKSMNSDQMHKLLVDPPNKVTRTKVVKTTVSPEYRDLIARLGATTEELKRINSIVRD